MAKLADSSLTVGERKKLTELEEIIERGVHSFMDVGNALAEIQKQKLYTDVGETFELYCKKRWQFSSSRARQLIGSAKVVTLLEESPIGDKGWSKNDQQGVTIVTPSNEFQARVLASLPDEQTVATVWAKAVETAPVNGSGEPTITAKHVAKVAAEITGRKKEPKKESEPEKTVVDKDGKPVPKSLEPLFKRAKEFEALCKSLDDIAKAVEKLAAEPIGVHLHAQSVVADLQNAKSAIRFSKPYAVCPYCKGKGEVRGDNCGACRKSGFVGRNKLKGAPEEMRA